MKNMLEGTGVAIVTPFNTDLSVDYDSLEKMLEHAIAGGLNSIVALGTTAETATLSKEERDSIVDFCKSKIAGRTPLIVGAGGNNTAEVVKAVKALEAKGIDGILSVAPYYNKPSQEGIIQHFTAIANSTSLPVIIYNVPGRTSSNIAATTAITLAKKCKNIVAVKEASGNFSQIMEIIKNKPDGFEVLSGDDALTLPMISLGAKGVISVIANSHPAEYSKLVKFALDGDFENAKKIQYKLLSYIDALFEEGSPSGVKCALESLGLVKNYVRLPLVPVTSELGNKLKDLLKKI